jgi:CRM1 C terminal
VFTTTKKDILAVMTDMLHKSCFKAHATLLRHMFHLTQMGQVTVQLWDDAQGQAAAAAGNIRTNTPTFSAEKLLNICSSSASKCAL